LRAVSVRELEAASVQASGLSLEPQVERLVGGLAGAGVGEEALDVGGVADLLLVVGVVAVRRGLDAVAALGQIFVRDRVALAVVAAA